MQGTLSVLKVLISYIKKPKNDYKNASVLLQFQISLMRGHGSFRVSYVLTGAAFLLLATDDKKCCIGK